MQIRCSYAESVCGILFVHPKNNAKVGRLTYFRLVYLPRAQSSRVLLVPSPKTCFSQASENVFSQLDIMIACLKKKKSGFVLLHAKASFY